jgi:hypothetical protein
MYFYDPIQPHVSPSKSRVWTLLQNHTIWMDKSPDPIQKTNLVPMGFWAHVHPGFVSTRAFNTQLCQDLRDRYADADHKALNLPDEYSNPEMYFQATKCRGIYDGAAINLNAMVMFGSPEDFDRTTIMLTCISKYAEIDDDKIANVCPIRFEEVSPGNIWLLPCPAERLFVFTPEYRHRWSPS